MQNHKNQSSEFALFAILFLFLFLSFSFPPQPMVEGICNRAKKKRETVMDNNSDELVSGWVSE